jgi:hypothetical protein
MNIRAQARTGLRAQPKKGKAPDEFLGIELRAKQDFGRFKYLKNRDIKSSKWVCPAVINPLGIGDDFSLLINNVRL